MPWGAGEPAAALQQRVDRRRGRLFRNIDQVFSPDQGRNPFFGGGASDVDGHVTALIVRSVVANLLAAGTKAGHRDLHSKNKIVPVAFQFADQRTLVVHQGPCAAFRSDSFQEKREGYFHVGGVGPQPLLQPPEDYRQGMYRHFTVILVEYFDEAAHVSPLDLLPQIHPH